MVVLMLVLMVLTNAGETICYKNTKEKDSFFSCLNICLWSFILSILVFLVYLGVDGKDIFVNFNWVDVVFILILALLSIFNIISWFVASRNMPMSIAEGVSEIYIAFLTLFSWLFFGGELTILQICMVALVIVSCICLSFFQKSNKVNDYNLKKGFFFLVAWIIVAVARGLIPGKLSNSGLHPALYSLILNFFMLLIALILVKVKKQNVVKSFRTLKDSFIILISVCRIVGQLVIIYLATIINLGIIDAVSVLGLVIIVLYERIIMKEKISMLSYLFLLLITVGSFILMLV